MNEQLTATLLDVFVNWVEQRLTHMGKKDMLLGELPDLRDTQSGKDLINIGRHEGQQEGRREMLLTLMKAKFGELNAGVVARVEKVASVSGLENIAEQVLRVDSIDGINWSVEA
ncbi:MAG: DUF4351 domain-containing protein [Planctomycetota bacterium]|nr:DUF4351 domain-containing protein [Planctomycetota bacterium]